MIHTSLPLASQSAGATIEFADGLPGFETHRQFVVLSGQAFEPFTVLQGLGPGAPSFAAIDPRQTVAGYAPGIGAGDLARIGADESTPLVWLAIVSADADGHATVNLRAPIVINPATLRGVQLIDVNDSNGAQAAVYRFDHPLRAA